MTSLTLRLKTYLFFGMIALLIPINVLADTVATQCSYAVHLNNAGLVFVMISDKTYNECVSQGPEKAEAAKRIRNTYKASGLYSENNPEPLWTVDWYSYKVFLSADGKYLVRTGPWASKDSDEAISFFADGKLLKTCEVKDIIRYVSALPPSVSHFEWQKDLAINDSKGTFDVTTLEGGDLTFNLANGERIEQKLPLLPPAGALSEPSFYVANAAPATGICVVGIVILLLLLSRRRKNRRST